MRRRIFMSGDPKQEPLLAEQELAAALQGHFLDAEPDAVDRVVIGHVPAVLFVAIEPGVSRTDIRVAARHHGAGAGVTADPILGIDERHALAVAGQGKFGQGWYSRRHALGNPSSRRAGRTRVGRWCIVCLAGVEAIPAPAEDELMAGLEYRVADANESAVGRIEIGEDPERSAFAVRAAEFGVTGGHQYVVTDAEVALGSA